MKKQERRAEDILVDDFGIGVPNPISHYTDEEHQLASDIQEVIYNEKQIFTPTEKKQLGDRIDNSIALYKRKRLLLRISSAAVLLLTLGISAVLTTNRESTLKSFAQSSNAVLPTDNTRLILSGNEEIQIGANESKIEYVGSGKQIHINATDNEQQVVTSSESAFNTVIVPNGKRTQITLSDNSTIWLNSGSKLIYPAKFAKEVREVYLEGEAIFEVSHNREQPFYVITKNVEVKVLGTVFDVCAYNDDATTSTVLEKGSVELKYNNNSLLNKQKVVMTPGTIAVYDPIVRQLEQSKVNTHVYTSWREGYFVFEKQSLSEILKKISRYYDVSIELQDNTLESETFTGNLDLRNSAVQVLEVIGEIINARIEKKEDKIIITRI